MVAALARLSWKVTPLCRTCPGLAEQGIHLCVRCWAFYWLQLRHASFCPASALKIPYASSTFPSTTTR